MWFWIEIEIGRRPVFSRPGGFFGLASGRIGTGLRPLWWGLAMGVLDWGLVVCRFNGICFAA